MIRYVTIPLMLVALLVGSNVRAAEEKDIEWLFVQSAQKAMLKDGVLTLEGVSPTTIFFSDRPERMAGHGATSEFATFWTTGGGNDNFAKDPPNATLSVVTEGVEDEIVLTLNKAMLDGDTLRYDVTIIDGRDQVDGGPSSLFIDIVGMPLTPVSVAGVRRRAWRRARW